MPLSGENSQQQAFSSNVSSAIFGKQNLKQCKQNISSCLISFFVLIVRNEFFPIKLKHLFLKCFNISSWLPTLSTFAFTRNRVNFCNVIKQAVNDVVSKGAAFSHHADHTTSFFDVMEMCSSKCDAKTRWMKQQDFLLCLSLQMMCSSVSVPSVCHKLKNGRLALLSATKLPLWSVPNF